MRLHILGICGTFMGGLALLARELGFQVSGSDQNVYPPMSTQLEASGIRLNRYDPANLEPRPDLVVIGNALSRGNPEVEAVLNLGIPYTSGPQWLFETVLQQRQVIAVAGTHGKTTTASMVAWILEGAGRHPGFLIGGVPNNFARSARLGSGSCFVVEADEYDTAFFDKRSKFLHYRPNIVILNNLEFDHADIFADLAAIQKQFYFLLRTVPGNGRVIAAAKDANLDEVLEQGCWTPVERFGLNQGEWQARLSTADGSRFQVFHHGVPMGEVRWEQMGRHNVNNALAAIAAAHQVRVDPEKAVAVLNGFAGVRRRLELRGRVNGISVYDDFAHHPTAIATTLQGLRARIGRRRLFAILEPRSNTMRLGIHTDKLGPSLAAADKVFLYAPAGLDWDPRRLANAHDDLRVFRNLEEMLQVIVNQARADDHLVFMSNGGFGNIHQRVLAALKAKEKCST